MTISAQVIDTIVEWIDDNLHQPLRRLPATRVTRSGTCSGCLCSTKGRVWGAISVNASCCWRRAICVNPTPGCTTSACVTGLTRSRRLPASLPARSTSRLARTVKRTIARHINLSRVGRVRRSRHPAFLWAHAASENQRRQTKRSTKNSIAPSSKNHTQNRMV